MQTDVPSGRRSTINTTAAKPKKQVEKKNYSIFEVALDFFDSCRLLESPLSTVADAFPALPTLKTLGEPAAEVFLEEEEEDRESKKNDAVQRFSCSTCRATFESLQDQRSHFKSDFHRFNIKLSIAGKDTVKEEDFDETTSDSLFKDYDISSISGSEDEDDKESVLHHDVNRELGQSLKNKIFVQLPTGEKFSVWKCLLLDESEKISFENDKAAALEEDGKPCLTEREVIEKLRYLIHEPRDNTHLRVLLLARGGHFAGCVFDGNSVVGHKTFHRYVIRAKAGKKQSSKDSSGKIAHSAGASIRRYNELALKKDIRELLSAWKPYFDAASCVFIHAPSNNRQLLFDGEKPYFSCLRCGVRNIPLTVRRPTLKEARRLYNVLTQISFEADEETATIVEGDSHLTALMMEQLQGSSKENLVDSLDGREIAEATIDVKRLENLSISSESESEMTSTSTPLHEASKSGNAEKVLELLEQGLDPCIKDERGRTPYMLATEKDVRNTFRRFMASNLDKWDWPAAKVPSPLTKEMEESQAAKQAEKDAKRKARAKELKKLRKAKEKKAQAEAAQSGASVTENSRAREPISKEEQLRREQAAEREKRAAAAEKRMAALRATVPVTAPSSSQPNYALSGDIKCSCCHSSLGGKVSFHRYNYKYCSTSCMHVHREILEDG